MKICPQCQTEYDDTKKFCRHDGSSLVMKTAEAWVAGEGGTTCLQCGKPVDVGKKFCRHCGTKLTADTQPLITQPHPVSPPPAPNNLGSQNEDLSLAQQHYAHGQYKEAIPYFERLLVQEQSNRLYQLYWLLSQVKAYGLDGYENGVTELLQWQHLTQTEKPLARELLMLAGRACLKQGDLAAAEQRLLRAHHLSPSQDVSRLLAMVEEKKGDAARQAGDFEQALNHYQRATTYDPKDQTLPQKLTRLAFLRVQERQQKRQKIRKKVARGVGLGVAAVFLIGSGIFGYRKVQEWLQTPPSLPEVAAVLPQKLAEAESPEQASPPQQTELSSPTPSESAENPTGEEKLQEQEKTADAPPVAESPERSFPSEGITPFTPPTNIPEKVLPPLEKPQTRSEEPKRVAKATERRKMSAAKALEQKLHQEGFHGVKVRGSDIVVTLTGEVRSREERDKVLRIARREAKQEKYTLEWNIDVVSSQ